MSGNEMALESIAEAKLSDLVDSKLLKFCKYINKVRDQDDDWIILVSGQTGSGKSTLAILLAMIINENFDIERNVVFDGRVLGKRIYETRGDTFVFDEAIFDAFNRDSMSNISKWLMKVFTVCRERNHVLFVVIPKVGWLDKVVKERIAFMFWTLKFYTKKGMVRGFYRAYNWTGFNPFEDSDFPKFEWNGKFSRLPPVFHSKYAMLKGDYAKEKLMEEESNPLAFMSKTAIAKALLQDPRFNIGKKDLYPIFGNVVYRL